MNDQEQWILTLLRGLGVVNSHRCCSELTARAAALPLLVHAPRLVPVVYKQRPPQITRKSRAWLEGMIGGMRKDMALRRRRENMVLWGRREEIVLRGRGRI